MNCDLILDHIRIISCLKRIRLQLKILPNLSEKKSNNVKCLSGDRCSNVSDVLGIFCRLITILITKPFHIYATLWQLWLDVFQ